MEQHERWPFARPASERRIAVVVAAVFAIVGSLWILFSDLVLYSFTHDYAVVARLETAKGWAFVTIAALLVYLVTLRGAAHLAKATRTLSAVLNSIGDGVLLLAADRTIAYANPAAVRMLQATGLDELCGMDAEKFARRFRVSFPDGRIVAPGEFIAQRAFDEGGTIRYKAILHPADGPELVVSCTAAAVHLEVGEPPAIVVSVLHDITTTEHLDQLRDDLFTETAHAIKTPITVIKSATQVLASTVPPRSALSTTLIERQCARIERLVENLLTLSRIRSGSLRLYPVELDLRPAIQDVIDQVSRLWPGFHIEVRLHRSVRAHVDRERLDMILRNILSAAFRESRVGDPVVVQLNKCGRDAEIAVSFHPHPSDRDSVDVRPSEVEFDDLGVARYVTANIVQAHGGTLREEADGSSTTIHVRLPALAEK